MSEVSLGVVKLEDALVHLSLVSVKLIKMIKAGVNLADVLELAKDEEFKALLDSAMQYKDVIAEAKDVQLSEAMQLVVVVVPKIIEALKA